MTFARFSEIVATVRYKPGWLIETQPRPRGLARVHVRGRVQHSATGKPWTIDFYGDYSPHACFLPREVIERVKRVIFEAEDHEFGEFFRVRGRRPYDPHRKKKL